MIFSEQKTASRKQTEYGASFYCSLLAARCSRARRARGFTLIETLVAVSLLTIAIVAPMTLTAKSLSTAYYARDQVTAFYLSQEAIESVRAIRDGNILKIATNQSGACTPMTLFCGIPIDQDFTIDATTGTIDQSACQSGTCPPLQTDGTLYGYQSGWTDTNFTRTVHVTRVGDSTDEIRVSVTVTWKTGGIQERSFTISSDLYRWVNDGSGA